MKRETLRHPKTYDLAARLNCSRPEAIGFLTLLWDYCADVAPQGDIGKWTDGVIARACEWNDDADAFISALVESGWLDRCDVHRLVIHDLRDHAARWWKLKLTKVGLDFVTPTAATVERTVEPTAEGTKIDSAASTAASTLLHPSHLHSSQKNGASTDVDGTPAKKSKYDRNFDRWWKTYPKKAGKGAAAKAFKKAFSSIAFDELMTVTEQFAASDKANSQYCPNPATWLNESRYEDDPAVWGYEQNPNSGNPPKRWKDKNGNIIIGNFTESVAELKELEPIIDEA